MTMKRKGLPRLAAPLFEEMPASLQKLEIKLAKLREKEDEKYLELYRKIVSI